MINRDTIIYGSFSNNPGNNGNLFFNSEFKKRGVNAIYKSFYSQNIEQSYQAAKTLSFGGFAVSMPFKREILKYVDEISYETRIIGASNTIKFIKGKSVAYNTDYIGIMNFFNLHSIPDKKIYILGDGGFASAARYALTKLELNFSTITRDSWEKIRFLDDVIIFNCTPVDKIIFNVGCHFVDAIPTTETGKLISKYQAEEQLKIYLT